MLRPAFISTLFATAAGAMFALGVGALCFGVWELTSLRAAADDAQSRATDDSAKAYALGQQALLASHSAAARASLMTLAIPPGGDVTFISDLEKLGASQHVDIGISSVSAVGPASGAPGSLTLGVQISCTYAACVRFVQLVETLPFAVSVPTLIMSYDQPTNRWKASFTLSVLSFDSP